MRLHFQLSKTDQQILLSKGTLVLERADIHPWKGDWIQVDGRCFVITEAHVCTNTKTVAYKRLTYAFTLRSQKDLAVFHVHEFSNGECVHCGFIPENIPNTPLTSH